MDSSISVSIIIPVYNGEKYIVDCLDSVSRQTFHDIEIICIDDKSTDNSLSILEKYAEKDERIRIIRLPHNIHQGGARNAGLETARGKYIWFIDADDIIDRDAVETLYDEMEDLGDVDVLSFNADAFQITESGERIPFPSRNIKRIWPQNTKLVFPGDESRIPSEIGGSSVTYFSRRSFIAPYRYRPNVFFEDACFTFSVMTADGVFYQMDYCPYHRRVSAESTTGLGDTYPPAQIKDRIIAMQDIAEVIKQRGFGNDHFGVVWFKKYASFFIRKYAEKGISEPKYDAMVEQLQEEWKLFKKFPQILKRRSPVVIALGTELSQLSLAAEKAEQLLKQYFVPDHIVLWLLLKNFPGDKNPGELQSLVNRGLEIARCDDITPAAVLKETLKKYPDAAVITTGDVESFPENWLSQLYRWYLEEPCIHCARADRIEISARGVRKSIAVSEDPPRYHNKPDLSGYVLYPSYSLHPDFFDQEACARSMPDAPDLWIWLMAVQNGFKVKVDPVDDREKVLDQIENKTPEISTYEDEMRDALDAALKDHPLSAWRLKDENRTELQLRNARNQLSSVQNQLKLTRKKLQEANAEIDRSEQEIKNLRATWSYRSGRALMYIPRKIRDIMAQQPGEKSK